MTLEIKVPDLGESVVEATVGRWLREVGDRVEVGDPVVALETDKVDLEVGAGSAGVLTSIEVDAGQDVHVGDVLGRIDTEAAAKEDGKEGKPEKEGAAEKDDGAREEQPQREQRRSESDASDDGTTSVGASPVARRLAEEHDLDLGEIKGSGSSGRVIKSDVEKAIGRELQQFPDQDRVVEEAEPSPVKGREERVRMSRRRRTIARRLVQAQSEAAMLTTFNDVDMGSVMRLRKEYGEKFARRHSVKLGITSFFVRAATIALKEFPNVNASMEGDEIIYKHYYDIGIAVGAEEGLVVPVIRGADQMSFAEIEHEIMRLVQTSEEGSLKLDDLQGGTFSITNGGVFGSLLSTPILNPPQVAILGLHRIEPRPVVKEGQVIVGDMMYLALTYDHRLVDGRQAVQFLVRIKQLVEDPGALMLEA